MGGALKKGKKNKDSNAAQGETYKIIVVGDGGVGKSAITIQFIQNRFEEEYDPTIEDTYQKFTEVDRKKVCLNVVDTAGQEDYIAMRDSWLRMGDGFVLVFSILEQQSFREIQQIKEQIMVAKDSNSLPLVVVGNKKDLADNRQVTFESAQQFAHSLGSPYVETSAKTGENVERVFQDVVRQCRQKKKT